MGQFRSILLSELEKVKPAATVSAVEAVAMAAEHLVMLKNEVLSFQVAYTYLPDETQKGWDIPKYRLAISSPLAARIKVRDIVAVPALMPVYFHYDEDVIDSRPALLPDLLQTRSNDMVTCIPHVWKSLWLELGDGLEAVPQGIHPVTLSFINQHTGICEHSHCLEVQVLPLSLPAQRLLHTEWLHADCLADYYCCTVFDERHWALLENFIYTAVQRGINLLFTPLFTPPLDTAVGIERTTVQLVQVTQQQGSYRFDFSLLSRWVDMGLRCGVQGFEFSHLATQWGAKHAPKVMAQVDGHYQQLFGWETDSTSPAYLEFLQYMLTALTLFLEERKLQGCCFFHISDEPRKEHLVQYLKLKQTLERHIGEATLIDAISDYDYYKSGALHTPVINILQNDEFIRKGVAGFWTYYCCSEYQQVSNRFLGMPLSRCRIIGIQLYKFKAKGFLHWGYNFYNTQLSFGHINPYITTDAGGGFPAGDAYLVYPGAGGKPEESLRLMALQQAMQDLRALELLEQYVGREAVVKLIDKTAGMYLTFAQYPHGAGFILQLRGEVYQLLESQTAGSLHSL